MRSSGPSVTVGGGTAATGSRADPFAAFNFWVEIDGLIVGGFTEVSGLQLETETTPVREGGQNGYAHVLPGPARYPQNLVLKRGLTSADALWEWCQGVAEGRIVRRNGTIYLLKVDGETALAWNFRDAYPVRWTGPDLRGDSSAVAFEAVELAHRGIARAAAGSSPRTRG